MLLKLLFLFTFSFKLHASDDYNIKNKLNLDINKNRFINQESLSSPKIEEKIKLNSEERNKSNFFNSYLTNYNHSGIYLFGGASFSHDINISGVRHTGNTFQGIKFPQKDLNTGFYFALGGRKQIAQYFILGIEAFYHRPNVSNISNWHVSGYNSSNVATDVNLDSKLTIDQIVGAKLKIGLAIWRFMPYGTIGYAYLMGKDKTYNTPYAANLSTTTVNDIARINSHGIVYGGGLEFLLTDNIILRAEYSEYLFHYSHKIYHNTAGQTLPIGETGNTAIPKVYSDTVRFSNFLIGVAIKF